FPAYELLLDDLRDYRFYASDLLHPSPEAVSYIWEKFQNACMSKETREFIKQWRKIRQKLHHRPFNPKSKAHQRFLMSLKDEIVSFEAKFDVKSELLKIENQLTQH
ncbi:MAG: GSCFA domain-containing protein, partial [Bacteroidota bacterium]